MAGWLHFAGMAVAGLGIFFGFYYLPAAPRTALAIVTVTNVGVVGVLAFVRHVFFHRSDTERLGWQTDRPDWAFEVGFANLAFGLMGFLAGLGTREAAAPAIVLLGYSLYLLQAALLHLYRYLTDPKHSRARLWRSVVATLLYVAMMTFFAVHALRA